MLLNRAMRHKLITLASLTLVGASLASAATFGRVVPTGGLASDIALDEPRGVLDIADHTSSRIDVMSLANNTLVRSIGIPAYPVGVAFGGDGFALMRARIPISDTGLTTPTQVANTLRFDLRDYFTPLSDSVLASRTGIGGWMHDLLVMVAVSGRC